MLAGSGLTTDLTTISTLVDTLKQGGHDFGAAGMKTTPITGFGSALGNLDGRHHISDLLKPDGSRH